MLVYLQSIDDPADRAKFEDLYRTYRGLMLYVANQILRSQQDAEDAGKISKKFPGFPVTKSNPISLQLLNGRRLTCIAGNSAIPPASFWKSWRGWRQSTAGTMA